MTRIPIIRAARRAARCAGLALFTMLLAARAMAGVTLAWDAVSNASGYHVYYGTSPGSYASRLDVGNVTTYTVNNLVEGTTYYFAATAYDSTGAESGFSQDVSSTVPYAVPKAQFSASATSGVAPLALNFLDQSTGSITSYAWTFGDGGTSTAANPSHVYSAPGVYSVALTVAGPGGTSTSAQANLITVTSSTASSPPVAQFSASTTNGFAPLTVTFTSTSTGTISTYSWSFGDGATSTEANPTHTYSVSGSYTVSLTVSGPSGSNTQTRSNYVRVKRNRG